MRMGNFEGEVGSPMYSIWNTAVTCEKMAEPIMMLFRLWAWTGPRNHELDGVQIPMRRGNFGGKGRPLLSMWTFCRELWWNSCTDRLAVWVVDSGGPKEAQVEPYLPDAASVHNFNRIRQVAPMYPTTLCRELCKNRWTDRLICRLGCALGWAEGSTSSVVFARCRQCANMGWRIGASWQIWLNCPSATVVLTYVITLTTCLNTVTQ